MTTDLIPHLRAMAAFSGGRMSKAELALVLCAGKYKGRGNTGRDISKENDDAETKAAEQRRMANARDRRLAVAPQHVKERWQSILALHGRDRQKKLAEVKVHGYDSAGHKVQRVLLAV